MFCPEKYCTNCLGVLALWGTELVDPPNVILKFLQIIETWIIVPIWPVVQGIFHHSHPTTNLYRPFVVYNTVEHHLAMHCAVTSEFGNPFLREILKCWKWGVGFLWHCFWKSGNSNLTLDIVTLKMFFNQTWGMYSISVKRSDSCNALWHLAIFFVFKQFSLLQVLVIQSLSYVQGNGDKQEYRGQDWALMFFQQKFWACMLLFSGYWTLKACFGLYRQHEDGCLLRNLFFLNTQNRCFSSQQ